MKAPHNPHSLQRLKKLKPRQRKKMHVGEFREQGFHFVLTLQNAELQSSLLAHLLAKMDETGVILGGHFSKADQLEGFITLAANDSSAHGQYAELITWLNGLTEVKSVEAAELIDAWHSV